MKLTIHRGTHEIGGTCIELATGRSRILVDAGLPLADSGMTAIRDLLPKSLIRSLDKNDLPLEGILISHSHQDHYGLLDCFPMDVPVYAGKASAALIKLGMEVQGKHESFFKPIMFTDRRSFGIGEFIIKPYLVDHSGFDSYAFLIEAEGRRIFYSGDFREHGYKGKLLERLLQRVPDVDVLLMEGTVVGQERNGEFLSEKDLVEPLAEAMKKTKGIFLVTASSTNIDRLSTLVKACNKAHRHLTIDPYTAEILDRLRKIKYADGRTYRIPHPSWPNIHVCYPGDLCRWLERNGNQAILKRHLQYGKPWQYFMDNASRITMVVRPSFSKELFSRGYFDLSQSRWIYSMWNGYLKKDRKLSIFKKNLEARGTATDEYIHTGGHAGTNTLVKMGEGMKYRHLIPIHTSCPEQFSDLFQNVMLLNDGEPFQI